MPEYQLVADVGSLSKLPASRSKITQASDDAAGLADFDAHFIRRHHAAADRKPTPQQATFDPADGGWRRLEHQRHSLAYEVAGIAAITSSVTVTDSSRAYLNSEFTALTRSGLTKYRDRHAAIAGRACWMVPAHSPRGASVLVRLDVGRYDHRESSTIFTSATLGVDTLDVSTQAGATAAIDALDTAIDTVSRRPRDDRCAGIALQFQRQLDLDACPRTCRPLIPRSPSRRHRSRAGAGCRLRRSRECRGCSRRRDLARRTRMPHYLLKLLG